jgi:hypothetical protein
MTPEITRELLHAYLDDGLPEAETARMEQLLRSSEAVRLQLKTALQERDRGDHTVGAIWRRERLSCPTREQLGSYLLDALDADLTDYIAFHLETVGCPFCKANQADLKAQQEEESAAKSHQRRRKIFKSSAGLLSGKPPV